MRFSPRMEHAPAASRSQIPNPNLDIRNNYNIDKRVSSPRFLPRSGYTAKPRVAQRTLGERCPATAYAEGVKQNSV